MNRRHDDDAPTPTDLAIAGSNAGKRTVRAVRDGFAPVDRVMFDALDQIEADGRILPPTARLRAFFRELQKALEQSGRAP